MIIYIKELYRFVQECVKSRNVFKVINIKYKSKAVCSNSKIGMNNMCWTNKWSHWYGRKCIFSAIYWWSYYIGRVNITEPNCFHWFKKNGTLALGNRSWFVGHSFPQVCIKYRLGIVLKYKNVKLSAMPSICTESVSSIPTVKCYISYKCYKEVLPYCCIGTEIC